MLRKDTLSILSYRFASVSNSLGDEVNLEEYDEKLVPNCHKDKTKDEICEVDLKK